MNRTISAAVAMALLLWTAPAAGQQQAEELPPAAIEGGFSRLNANVAAEGISLSVAVDGWYFAGSVSAHERVAIYGAFNRHGAFGTSGNTIQAGGQFRLGPGRWIARPSLRAGIFLSDGDTRAGGGFALHIGRRAGGVLSADYTSVDGVLVAIIHVGGYIGFGGN